MKNGIARNTSTDDWATPPDFYEKLDREYHFDFDPCPYKSKIDYLSSNWGMSNYINPPYSRQLKEKFIRKALEESRKGKLCVMLLPVSTSTKIFHEVILPNATKIEFVKGRLKFGHENENGVIEYNSCGQHDSMIVVFDGRK